MIAKMAVKGVQAVILGCTELPLLLGDVSCALPVLDSTRLLAKAALEQVMTAALPADGVPIAPCSAI